MLKWNILWHAALLPTLEIWQPANRAKPYPELSWSPEMKQPLKSIQALEAAYLKMSRRAGPQICLPAAQHAPSTKNSCDLCRAQVLGECFSTMSNQPWALMTDRARHRSSSTVVLAFTTAWLQNFRANAMSMHTRTCTSTSSSTKIAVKTIYLLCAFHKHKKWTQWHPFA